MPTYSLVLVNYKTLDLTRTCLERLRAGVGDTPVPVYVVDNHSCDASTDYLRSLDWITLIERYTPMKEAGHLAHGRALDLALERIDTDYVFLLHTDTFIHDFRVFERMMARCAGPQTTAAVGCLEQLDRGALRTGWRLASRFCKHYTRRGLRALGYKAREPKPWREEHLKSFCTLWDVRLIRQHGLRLQLDQRNPGYALQERMAALGYRIDCVSPAWLFRFLDHVQGGTVAARGGYASDHRRTREYQQRLSGL